MIDEHLAIEVIELMLHHTGQIALNPLVVMLKLLIVPFDVNLCRTYHFLMNSGQRQAALF